MVKVINRQAKGREKVEDLYADIQDIDEFGIDPIRWARLHRWDRLALRYYLIMKNYYNRMAYKKNQRKEEQDRKFYESLPKLKRAKPHK